MFRQVLMIAALTSLLGTARAGSIFEVIQQAAEVPFSRIDWPSSDTGTLRFSMCSTCQLNAVRLERDTRYFVNQREVAYVDFAAALERIRAADERPLVGLFFDTQTRRLAKIVL